MNGPFDTGGPQSPPSKSDFVSVGIEFMREINAKIDSKGESQLLEELIIALELPTFHYLPCAKLISNEGYT